MRRYSMTVMLILVLICGATVLALWFFTTENSGTEDISEESSSVPVVNSVESSLGSDAPHGESSQVMAESSEESTDSSGQPSETETDWSYAIDITAYLKYIEPQNPEEFSMLVNKNTPPLADSYVPKNLVLSENARPGREEQCYMDATAAKALEAFLKEAAYYGHKSITVTNAYRSYSTQYYLFYDYYFKLEASKHPELTKNQILEIVSSYSFPPGQSEHQTGLCCDMHDKPVGDQDSFNHTESAEWLENNAYRFGFILRYPEGKEDVTGAIYESWHFRFVGRRLATYLYKNNLTLDEYYEKGYDIYSDNQ